MQEVPGFSFIAVSGPGTVPLFHPFGIIVIVIGTGNKLATARGVPEGFAHMAAREGWPRGP